MIQSRCLSKRSTFDFTFAGLVDTVGATVMARSCGRSIFYVRLSFPETVSMDLRGMLKKFLWWLPKLLAHQMLLKRRKTFLEIFHQEISTTGLRKYHVTGLSQNTTFCVHKCMSPVKKNFQGATSNGVTLHQTVSSRN